MSLIVVLAWAGTACSVIPTGNKPITFEDVRKGNPLGDPYSRVIATPPKDGWSPEDIVTGFRAAMASPDDLGREVARQYLTDDFAKQWNPQDRVMVYGTGEYEKIPPAREGKTRVTFKGSITAYIDQDGRYQPSGGTLSEPFSLVKQPNGWRISEAPKELLLSESDVDHGYLSVDLYFLDSQWKGLVIDQVRVPIDPASNFAKTAVERLLKGPSSLLRGAVKTAFEPGTRLIDVTTENNRVIINLNKRVAPDLVDPMAAQLAGTLSGLTKGGWGFEVEVNGESYYSDAPLRIDAQEQSVFDPWMTPRDAAPYYLVDGGLRLLLPKEKIGQAVPGRAGEKDETRTRPAISGQALRQVAALSKDGKSISVAPIAPGGEWKEWTTGVSLTPPSWDRYNTLWTVDRPNDHTSRVIRHDSDNRQQYRVTAPDLDTLYVELLKVARDGVHVAVVVRDGTEERVLIGTVIGQGSATRIDNLQPVVLGNQIQGNQTIEDIAWKDGKSLYMLTDKSVLLEASVVSAAKQLPSDPRIGSITALDGTLLAGAKEDNGKSQILYWNWTSAKWEALVKDEAGKSDFVENGPTDPAYPLG
ncbi:LpqB family beta-propeller domain-containing protein [Streptosporangium lutulentum]|uniref:GerMN domain-containing protein n=1 Tax=Streptosporangium lutulentum TaxID=1461250 RepID=A0ABT9QI58_9ACTN|nr:LpqB family beta-propeller domain-containing protein [Streptosporangium lutulentum]MDP9846436.1 hypothetical protein [Streptosporangium lutulentum]